MNIFLNYATCICNMIMFPILKTRNLGACKLFEISYYGWAHRYICDLYLSLSTLIPIYFVFVLIKTRCETRENDSALQEQ
jgi:hypothetical protein